MKFNELFRLVLTEEGGGDGSAGGATGDGGGSSSPAVSTGPGPATGDGDSMTGTDDVETMRWPVGMMIGRGSFFPKKKKKKKKKKKTVKESVLPSFLSVDDYIESALAGIAKIGESHLRQFGFSINVESTKITFTAPTGRKYNIYHLGDFLVAGRSNIGIVINTSDNQPRSFKSFLRWALPGKKESSQLIGSDSLAYHVSSELFHWIIKIETMTEFPAFVDLSADSRKKLSDSDMESIGKFFHILPSDTYSGSFNSIQAYKSKFTAGNVGSNTPLGMSTGGLVETYGDKILQKKPMLKGDNDARKRWIDWDWDSISLKIASMEFAGDKGTIKDDCVWWGERLRYVSTINSIDYLEALVPDGNGGDKWCIVHAVPKFPWEAFDEYMDEFKKFLKSYSIPDKPPSKSSFDWKGLLSDIWKNVVEDYGFTGGLAYHKDGEWGIVFYASGSGAGVPYASEMYAKYMQVYFRMLSGGLIKVCVDVPNEGTHTVTQPSASDINTYFYSNQGKDALSLIVNRYTYST